MNNYYTPLSPEDLQRRATAQRLGQQQQQQLQGHNIGMANTSNQSGPHRESLPLDTPMTGGDSLDDIVRQNTHELQRRQSVPHPFPGQMSQSEADRRLSMMDFGNDNDAFQNFQYGTMSGSAASNMSQAYGNMPSDSGSYGQPNIMAMSDQNNFASLSPDMMGNMMDFSSLNMGQMSADPHALSLYSQPVMGDQYPPTNLNTNFSMDMNVDNGPLSATSTHTAGGISIKQDEDMMAADAAGFGAADNSSAPRPRAGNNLDAALVSFQSSLPPHLTREVSGSTSNLQSPTLVTSRTVSQIPATPTATATPMTPASMALGPREPPQKSVYSRTGFDMLRALWYVATRKSQKIQLGAVDMSCAFVVCDVSQNDCPIIYVSDNFQHLTGYSSYEIIGQNCRFLQAPDGMVEAGTKREFVENHAVYNLKKAIANGEEIQQSLINYRKGGKPFLNLLTMIPIPWDTDEIRYFIGFQIDLVECPDAISGHDASGIAINYKHSSVPQYIWTPPSSSQWEPENGQTLGIDDVSTLLQQFNPKGIASDWHKQSWDKMLLENADDMIHVLSLKGLFQYVSPSCKKIINWDMNELVGKPLSTICHPSDIVPVMRELKDAQPHTPVNIVFRAHQKKIGFIWFECHGTLWSEQGKGRKSIILVGRKRPVYSLLRDDLEANGGIGDSEIWSKMSTSGMLLFVSSNVRSLLDLHPADLEGTSMQDLMRKESRIEFGRTIEKARKGKIVSCKHDIQNRRGQVLQAQTTFYPGDGSPDVKPTFIIGQTKLLKASSRSTNQVLTTFRPPPLSITADEAGVMAGGPVEASNLSPTVVVRTTSDGTVPQSLEAKDQAQAKDSAQAKSTAEVKDAAQAKDDLQIKDSAQAEETSPEEDNVFYEFTSTRCTSWQFELRQMEKMNRILAEELAQLLSNKKKRKRRKGSGGQVRDCANCHTRSTPEWRRGPSGNRDLCNSCGLRWAKQVGLDDDDSSLEEEGLYSDMAQQTGRVSPRNSSRGGNGAGGADSQSKKSNSPSHSSPLHRATPQVLNQNSTDSSGSDNSNTSASKGAIAPANAGNTPITTQMPTLQQQQQPGGPPQSTPLLEGGSGTGGAGMEMTSIREEMWETQGA